MLTGWTKTPFTSAWSSQSQKLIPEAGVSKSVDCLPSWSGQRIPEWPPNLPLDDPGGKAHICSLFPVPPLTCQSACIFSAFSIQAIQNISLYRGSCSAFRALAFSPGMLVRILLVKQCHSDGKEGVLVEFLSSEILQAGWKCFGLGLGILGSREIRRRRQSIVKILIEVCWETLHGKDSCASFWLNNSPALHLLSNALVLKQSTKKHPAARANHQKEKREQCKPWGECAREKYCRVETWLCWPDTMCIISPKGPRGLMDGALTCPEVSLCWTSGTSSLRASTYSWHTDLL